MDRLLAVFPSRRHLSAKVRVMVDFLVEAFKGIPPWDRQPSGLEPADVRGHVTRKHPRIFRARARSCSLN
jgi:hypothetical protein